MSVETQPSASTATCARGEPPLTQIPQRFLLTTAATGKTARESAGRGGRPSVHELMRNDEYTKKLARSSAGGTVSRYRVPVGRPLPLHTLEAGAGWRQPARNVESSLASLFRGSAEGAVVPDFLKPAEHSRRREIEERKERERQLIGDPDAKRRLLEPKQMPNLDKKVPVGFIPRCAAVGTQAIPIHADKAEAQAHTAPQKNVGSEV
ncbi:uncharacterized protein Tco025E_09106 [Trypanosoma conorhini]|uniref:Uncharacterized protein n=1 Tax=Trypanosoma conorhini TaxID=83891 RepID=A0A3R7KPU4_9TRYP|nr:uncharacterized protein Tco025E_09106 [Trypanosoma conorhini]RNE99007.1 hypothetical protein Tco025E_09106 [Trypanosoma conorhini]